MRDGISPKQPTLREILRAPDLMMGMSAREWDLLVRQARSSTLIARLAYVLDEWWSIPCPAAIRRHFEGERRVADKLAHDVLREVRRIAEPLAQIGVQVIVLKGAAYVVGGLPPARGRLFSDIDILVPHAVIPNVERRLMLMGWRPQELDAWDQRFYRKWMHEIPPLRHSTRETVVDVHHTIVPMTARIKLDARLLFDAAVPAAVDPTISILSPADMVLHSATHLFNEGEFDRGLRDLVDLDLLLRHFGAQEGFWECLVDRGRQLDLSRPLYFSLRYSSRFLGTPIPPAILARSERFAPAVIWPMDFLFEQALRPAHASCRDMATRFALGLLYIRAHYLRLPLQLLVPHLVRKSFLRAFARPGVGRTSDLADNPNA